MSELILEKTYDAPIDGISSSNYPTFTLQVYLDSQSISDNTSTLTIKIKVKPTYYYWDVYSGGQGQMRCRVYLSTQTDPVINSREGSSVSPNTEKEIGSVTKTVTHEDDGTLSITVSADWTQLQNNDYAPRDFSTDKLKGSYTLPTIDREAKLTSNKAEISPNNTTARITLSPFVKDFKYVIRRKVGSKAWEENWKTLGNGSTTSYFDDTYNNIKTRAGADGSYAVTYECTTYNGTTVVGTAQTCTIRTFYPGDPKPMELYQNGSNLGVAFLNRVDNTPGLYIGGRGPIAPINVTIDGTTYTLLGWKVN